MGARWRQVARQSLWASLTGGCFLDPHLGPFANCFHLYAWLFLLALPLLLYTMLPPGPGVLGLYCGLVAAFFGAVKAVNFRLHAALDRGAQPHGDPHPPEDEGGDEGGATALLGDRGGEEGDGNTRPPGGALELTELRRPPLAPPCSSQPSLCGFNQLSELLPQLDEPTDLQQLLWGRGSTNGIVTAADRHRLRRDPPGGTGGCPPPAADVPPPSAVPEPPRGGGGSGGGTPGTASTPLDTPSPWGGAAELSLASSPSSPSSSSSLSAEALPPPPVAPPRRG